MKETLTLRIDMSFRGRADQELTTLINDGWYILDKTVERERYIYYVLCKEPLEKMCPPSTCNYQ